MTFSVTCLDLFAGSASGSLAALLEGYTPVAVEYSRTVLDYAVEKRTVQFRRGKDLDKLTEPKVYKAQFIENTDSEPSSQLVAEEPETQLELLPISVGSFLDLGASEAGPSRASRVVEEVDEEDEEEAEAEEEEDLESMEGGNQSGDDEGEQQQHHQEEGEEEEQQQQQEEGEEEEQQHQEEGEEEEQQQQEEGEEEEEHQGQETTEEEEMGGDEEEEEDPFSKFVQYDDPEEAQMQWAVAESRRQFERELSGPSEASSSSAAAQSSSSKLMTDYEQMMAKAKSKPKKVPPQEQRRFVQRKSK